VIEELKKSGTVQRGWLGVKIQSITEDIADGLGLSDDFGALVTDVTEDSPAKAAGLRAGDAITEVNGRRIEDSRDLARKIADYTPGTTVKVSVRRGDRDVTIDVKLGRFPSSEPKVAMQNEGGDDAEPTALEELGLSLRANDRGDGVVIEEVDAESDAAEKGLRQGDVIVEVNSRKVSKPSDIDEQVREARKRGRGAVLMVISRGGQRRFVAVQFMEKEKKG
jgi:serine protease Do